MAKSMAQHKVETTVADLILMMDKEQKEKAKEITITNSKNITCTFRIPDRGYALEKQAEIENTVFNTIDMSKLEGKDFNKALDNLDIAGLMDTTEKVYTKMLYECSVNPCFADELLLENAGLKAHNGHNIISNFFSSKEITELGDKLIELAGVCKKDNGKVIIENVKK
ncbi:hypothetical protein [Anaerophilus nitritogenes]|uniref:hypothetical protein n=1 Tax=Anaerophilus nitritogenes TaxID=2498136 RepID=UPI00101BE4D3|nr:hypothetical protein [Anaerophilus nitritogenes]